MSTAVKRGANNANNNTENKKSKQGTTVVILSIKGEPREEQMNLEKESTFDDFFKTKHAVLGRYEEQNIEIIINDNPLHAQISRVNFPPPFHEEVIQGECIVVKKKNGIYEDLTIKEWEDFVKSDHSEALSKYNEVIEKELAEAESDEDEDEDDESEGSYGNIDDEDSSEAED